MAKRIYNYNAPTFIATGAENLCIVAVRMLGSRAEANGRRLETIQGRKKPKKRSERRHWTKPHVKPEGIPKGKAPSEQRLHPGKFRDHNPSTAQVSPPRRQHVGIWK